MDTQIVGVLRDQPSGGSRGGAAPAPLFLGQTEAWRAEKNFFETRPPLSQGLDDCPPPLLPPPPPSEGLDLPPKHHKPSKN